MTNKLMYVYGLPGTGRSTCIESYLEQNKNSYTTAEVLDCESFIKKSGFLNRSYVDQAYDDMLKCAENLMESNVTWVIIEGSFGTPRYRERFENLTKSKGYKYEEILTNVDRVDASFIKKLTKRAYNKFSYNEIDYLAATYS
jgi:hypothetical protein